MSYEYKIMWISGSGSEALGVLDTPCFPYRYYGGYVRRTKAGEWFTATNATRNFHRTVEEALSFIKKIYDRQYRLNQERFNVEKVK